MTFKQHDQQNDVHLSAADSKWLAQLADPATRDDAARMIFQKYSEQLLVLIRSRLAETLQKRTEPLDIMQSVWKSFFSRTFVLQDSDTLFPLLAEMCIRKSADAARRHTARKRDVRSEQRHDENVHSLASRPSLMRTQDRSLEWEENPAAGLGQGEMKRDEDSAVDQETLQLMARGATPEQAIIAMEIFEHLPSELQTIMTLRLEGLHDHEIAATLNCTRRTIVRRVALLRLHMERFLSR